MSEKIFKRFQFLSVLAIFFIISCGTPNPLEINPTLINPDKVTAYYDGTYVRLSITGLNSAELSPDFSGYNIFFDRVNTLSTIMNKVLYVNNIEMPSVSAFISSQATVTPANFDKLYYSNVTTGEIRQESFVQHESYFLIVRSYSRKSRAMSDSLAVTEVHIPKILLNQTSGENAVVSDAGNVLFRFVSSTLKPETGVGVQSLGYQSDWFNQGSAPTNGYVPAPVPLSAGSLYYLNYQSNYAKVWLASYNGVIATYHLSFLQNSPLL